MDTDLYELIKHREIHFSELVEQAARPAHSAILLLSDVAGIHRTTPQHDFCLQVSYDLRAISLKIIEDALVEVGFHLDGSLLHRLKRSLFYYTEETQLANLGHAHDIPSCTQEIFINRYRLHEHGCRDLRPQHLRKTQ